MKKIIAIVLTVGLLVTLGFAAQPSKTEAAPVTLLADPGGGGGGGN